MAERRSLIVVMGPSGCGKTTVARMLAVQSGSPVIEGDDHHSARNREKMASGHPLTDADRARWLDGIIEDVNKRPDAIVWLACSALTKYVQERLARDIDREVRFVLLDVSREELAKRLEDREDHFMPGSLLSSQLDALDPPTDAIRVDAERPVAEVVHAVLTALGNKSY